MLFTFLLFHFSITLSSTHAISKSNLFDRLDSFGFDEGGRFSARISSTEKFNTAIFLIPEDKYNRIIFSKDLQYNYCARGRGMNLFFQSTYSRFFYQNQRSYQWNVTVNISQTYVPLIANCYACPLTVSYEFRNSKSFLDTRENFIPIMYAISCYVSLLILIIWIVNSLRYCRFFVFLHSLFSFSSFFIFLSHFFQYKLWTSYSQYDYASPSLRFIAFIIDDLSISFLYTINSLASNGYGIYFENIKFALPQISSIFFFFFTNFIILQIIFYTHFFLKILFCFSLLFTSYPFLRFVSDGFQRAFALQSRYSEDSILIHKFELATRFSEDFMAYFIYLVITYIALFVGLYEEVHLILLQVLVTFILLYLDAFYFLYREAYNAIEIPVEEPPKDGILAQFQDPVQTEFVFINS